MSDHHLCLRTARALHPSCLCSETGERRLGLCRWQRQSLRTIRQWIGEVQAEQCGGWSLGKSHFSPSAPQEARSGGIFPAAEQRNQVLVLGLTAWEGPRRKTRKEGEGAGGGTGRAGGRPGGSSHGRFSAGAGAGTNRAAGRTGLGSEPARGGGSCGTHPHGVIWASSGAREKAPAIP